MRSISSYPLRFFWWRPDIQYHGGTNFGRIEAPEVLDDGVLPNEGEKSVVVMQQVSCGSVVSGNVKPVSGVLSGRSTNTAATATVPKHSHLDCNPPVVAVTVLRGFFWGDATYESSSSNAQHSNVIGPQFPLTLSKVPTSWRYPLLPVSRYISLAGRFPGSDPADPYQAAMV